MKILSLLTSAALLGLSTAQSCPESVYLFARGFVFPLDLFQKR